MTFFRTVPTSTSAPRPSSRRPGTAYGQAVSLSGDYERIGVGYAEGRRPEPSWAAAINSAVPEGASVVNVGAGAGSYEPSGQTVLAVDPSPVMLAQRPASAAPAVYGVAEALPLRDHSVDVALAVLTVHHWADWRRGVTELRRVAARRIVLTFDPAVTAEFWLVRDYLPGSIDIDFQRTPPVSDLADSLGNSTVIPLLVPPKCADGVLPAHWREPEAYLDPAIRGRASSLAHYTETHPDLVERGIARLADDVRSGAWRERYAGLFDLDAYDGGFRLIVSAD
jgi:SAM-dependent methyltransferase